MRIAVSDVLGPAGYQILLGRSDYQTRKELDLVRTFLGHRVDGLLLTGSGPDLPPRLYGERQRYKFPLVSERRANFELDLVHLAQTRDLPVLGICGGMQTINVACGGSLFQDLTSQMPHVLQHRQTTKAIHLAHSVDITAGSLLRKIVTKATLRVNSSHHQSVPPTQLDASPG